jgi:hypothetical protein
VVAFLASDEAREITGSRIAIEAGSMNPKGRAVTLYSQPPKGVTVPNFTVVLTVDISIPCRHDVAH